MMNLRADPCGNPFTILKTSHAILAIFNTPVCSLKKLSK